MPSCRCRPGDTTLAISRLGSSLPVRSTEATDLAAIASNDRVRLRMSPSSCSVTAHRSMPREGAVVNTVTSRDPPVNGSGRIK